MTQKPSQRFKRYRPQKISLPSPPGSRLKRSLEIGTRVRLKEIADHDPTYLTLIRACPCLRCAMDPAGIAAHVRMQSGAFNNHAGMGKKPSDRFVVPLCADCHTDAPDSQHRIGEREFWSCVGINPHLVCTKLYEKRGDLIAMRAVATLAIAERESRLQSAAVINPFKPHDED